MCFCVFEFSIILFVCFRQASNGNNVIKNKIRIMADVLAYRDNITCENAVNPTLGSPLLKGIFFN